ncbi:hypothetical protein PV328_007649 [Microctonus aethiopoides]|uniref:Uncharacterized protein n=1 Tax=Microctonus aethiopoides TaxID=144406 RepID=A0AA39C981_9HYME|nr:hypothetical protein PV328_007649 [Microctonus aethiopoides]
MISRMLAKRCVRDVCGRLPVQGFITSFYYSLGLTDTENSVSMARTQEKSGSRTTNQRFAPTNQRWRNPEANSNENPKPYGYIRKNTDSHKKLINENDPRENNADEEEAGDMLDSLPG